MPKPKKMKSIIKITIASMIYKAMQVLPISENRIFFQSYEKADGFIDNPKYICRHHHSLPKLQPHRSSSPS